MPYPVLPDQMSMRGEVELYIALCEKRAGGVGPAAGTIGRRGEIETPEVVHCAGSAHAAKDDRWFLPE